MQLILTRWYGMDQGGAASRAVPGVWHGTRSHPQSNLRRWPDDRTCPGRFHLVADLVAGGVCSSWTVRKEMEPERGLSPLWWRAKLPCAPGFGWFIPMLLHRLVMCPVQVPGRRLRAPPLRAILDGRQLEF